MLSAYLDKSIGMIPYHFAKFSSKILCVCLLLVLLFIYSIVVVVIFKFVGVSNETGISFTLKTVSFLLNRA